MLRCGRGFSWADLSQECTPFAEAGGILTARTGLESERNQGRVHMDEHVAPRMPGLGEEAPDFEAVSTFGPIRLSDFRGKKWVVLFSHPADFTPV